MKRHLRFRDARGQALVEYVALIMFVLGSAVVMIQMVAPVFRRFMISLIRLAVKPFTS